MAVPNFRNVVANAMRDDSATPFRIPEGVRLVRVDPVTGLLANPGAKNTILEAFRQGSFPNENQQVLDGINSLVQKKSKVQTGTGGIY